MERGVREASCRFIRHPFLLTGPIQSDFQIMYMFVLVNINYMFILMFVATCICFYHKLSLPFSIKGEMGEMVRRYVRGDTSIKWLFFMSGTNYEGGGGFSARPQFF